MVAGKDHDLLVATHPCDQAGQDARSCGERVSEWALAHLDHIPEQDQPIGGGGGVGERLDDSVVIERRTAVARADVQVGDD
jgi:hypothetical protein